MTEKTNRKPHKNKPAQLEKIMHHPAANGNHTKPTEHHALPKPPLPLLALSLTSALLCSGCLASKSYVDPQFRDAGYASVKPCDSPVPVNLTVEFQVNGKPSGRKQVVEAVRRKITRLLTATRVFMEATPAAASIAGQLHVTINNYADLGGAVGKGFATGLTFGLAGSEVVDNYEMIVTHTPPEGVPITRKYQHAIHTTIGAHKPPPGMEPVPLADAFDQVVEEMLLNFLRDLQRKTPGQTLPDDG